MGDYYFSPSLTGDYFFSPSLMGDYYVSFNDGGTIMSLLHWTGTIMSLFQWWGTIMSPLHWWGLLCISLTDEDSYVSPSMIGDYYVSPSLIGRCCFTINSSIFLLPLPKQIFILMLCAFWKKQQIPILQSFVGSDPASYPWTTTLHDNDYTTDDVFSIHILSE
jgi:hypothetical protein